MTPRAEEGRRSVGWGAVRPLLPALLVVTVGVCLWHEFRAHEHRLLELRLREAADNAAAKLTAEMRTQMASLGRLADRSAGLSDVSHVHADMRAWLNGFPGFDAIVLTPTGPDAAAFALGAVGAADARSDPAFAVTATRRQPRMGPLVRRGGRHVVWLHVPGTQAGVVSARLVATPWLKGALPPTARSHALSVRAGQTPLIQVGSAVTQDRALAVVDLPGTRWTLEARPTGPGREGLYSLLPELSLAAAFLIGALLVVTIHFSRVADAHAERLRREIAVSRERSAQLLQAREKLDAQRRAALNLAQDAEAARRMAIHREEQFRRVVEAAPNGMAMMDASGRIVLVNDALLRMLGRTAAEVAGADAIAVLPIERSDLVPDRLRRLTGGVAPALRYAWRRDGDRLPVQVHLSSVDFDERHYALASVIDMSERVRTEQEIRRQAEHLERTNRALDEFAYIVSHDLKAPLRAICALAEWVAEDAPELGAESAEHLSMLRQRAQRMSRLIDGILRYSRVGLDAAAVETFESGPLIEQVVDAVVPDTVATHIDANLPRITYDVTMFEQVVQNLLSNAVLSLPATGGRIEIRCTRLPSADRFEVCDNGCGVPPAQQTRIFKIFQSLRPRDEQEATGVGLAIVKKIVETFGGSVTVVSREDAGSCFAFTVPRAGRRGAGVAEDAAPPLELMDESAHSLG